jgi:hypothetical protein
MIVDDGLEDGLNFNTKMLFCPDVNFGQNTMRINWLGQPFIGPPMLMNIGDLTSLKLQQPWAQGSPRMDGTFTMAEVQTCLPKCGRIRFSKSEKRPLILGYLL